MASITVDASFVGKPLGSERLSEADDRIRDTRKAWDERQALEHKAAADTNNQQGQHRAGSAISYRQASAPTTRPDGVTALDANDAGRLWLKTSDLSLHVYSGTAWVLFDGGAKGTSKVFYQTTAPTTNANGDALTSVDAGLLWVNSTNASLSIYSGTAWTAIMDSSTYTNLKAPQIFNAQTTQTTNVIAEVSANIMSVFSDYIMTFCDGYFSGTNTEKNYAYKLPYTITPEAFLGGATGALAASKIYGLWASYDVTKLDTLGTAASATGTTIVLANTASAVDDYYNGGQIYIVSGTGSGQTKTIADYTGNSRTCAVSTWGVTPDATSVYYVMAGLSFITHNLTAAAVTYTLGATDHTSKTGGNCGWDKPAVAASGLVVDWFWYQADDNKTYRCTDAAGAGTWVQGYYCFLGSITTDGSKNITVTRPMVNKNYLLHCTDLGYIFYYAQKAQYCYANQSTSAGTENTAASYLTSRPSIINPLWYLVAKTFALNDTLTIASLIAPLTGSYTYVTTLSLSPYTLSTTSYLSNDLNSVSPISITMYSGANTITCYSPPAKTVVPAGGGINIIENIGAFYGYYIYCLTLIGDN
jgi:hypothetical protein